MLCFVQIGIMLLGTMIDNLVVGGPAYNSRQLHHGDIILKVDGIPVNQNNIHEIMVGNDSPGSPMVVSVARGGPKVHRCRLYVIQLCFLAAMRINRCYISAQGPVVDVRTTRMATEEIHDRRRMFELFTALKVRQLSL